MSKAFTKEDDGRALLGARVGDLCEVTLPRGSGELEVVALEHEE